MTKDDVIRMAREADAGFEGATLGDSIVGIEALLRFAQLVAAHEREECAKLCASLSYGVDCLEAIRARGNA